MISAPHLNPVTFRPITNGAYAYNTHHFDEWWHWEQYQKEHYDWVYFQPHLANKPFHLQFESDQPSINYKILNCEGTTLDSGVINTAFTANSINADYFIAPNAIHTTYTSWQSWMVPGTTINITGSSNPANNGTYTLDNPAFNGSFGGFILNLTTSIPDPTAFPGVVTYSFSPIKRFFWNFDVIGLGISVADEDVIYVCVDDGLGNALITEPIKLFLDLPDNVIEYKADGERNDFDWVFYDNGNISLPSERPFFYAESHIKEYEPSAEAERYDDQVWDSVTLSSTPYRTFKLFIGDDYGVPDYVVEKINRYLACDHVYLDGKEFTINGKSKIDMQHNKFYGFIGASVELREALNRFHIQNG